MAFVFSQERWNNDKEKGTPGPGHYLTSKTTSEKKKKNRILTVNRKITHFQVNSFQPFYFKEEKPSTNNKSTKCISKLRNHYSQKDKKDQTIDLKIGIQKSNNVKLPLSQRSNVCIAPLKTIPSIRNVEDASIFLGNQEKEKEKKSNRKRKAKTIDWLEHYNRRNLEEVGQLLSQYEKIMDEKVVKKEKKTKKEIVQILYDDTATRVGEDLSSVEDEYVPEATPGPGSYDIKPNPTTKRNLMFTAAGQRFTLENEQKKEEIYYSNKDPNFKKTSKANQKKVAFGSTKQKNDKGVMKNDKFYEDLNSLENKSLKKMLLSEITGKKFEKQKKKIRVTLDQPQKNEENLTKVVEELYRFNNLRQGSTFLSKSKRLFQKQNCIPPENYYGQAYKTIEKDLQNQNKQEVQDVAFLRFVNKDECQTQVERLKDFSEIRHGLIETMNGFRYRNTEKSKKKGFTFGRASGQDENKQNYPSPDLYETGKKWEKKSHNRKFQNN